MQNPKYLAVALGVVVMTACVAVFGFWPILIAIVLFALYQLKNVNKGE